MPLTLRTFTHNSDLSRWRLTMGTPAGPLAAIADFFWDVAGTTTFPQQKILPEARYFLIFNLAGSHGVVERDSTVRPYQRAWTSGLQEEHLIAESSGYTHLVGVRFHLAGAYRFFRMPLNVFTGRVIEVEDLFGLMFGLWAEQLAGCMDSRARFILLSSLIER